MANRTFLVALDARDPNSSAQSFGAFLRDNSKVTDWWNHIPFVYLVVSQVDADTLAADVSARSGCKSFLVTETNLHESEGLLPDKAWDWIRTQSAEIGRSQQSAPDAHAQAAH